jgi:hypothetical protein
MPGYMSPDEHWAFCQVGEKVVNRSNLRWDLAISDLFGEDGLNYGVKPLFWTQDNKYLYFAPYHLMDWENEKTYELYFALERMDLETGKIDIVLPLTDGFYTFYMLSISPTGRRLAYSNGGSLSILDLKTGAEVSFPTWYSFASDFSWSPDGTELTFLATGGDGLFLARVDAQHGTEPVLYVVTPVPTPTSIP